MGIEDVASFADCTQIEDRATIRSTGRGPCYFPTTGSMPFARMTVMPSRPERNCKSDFAATDALAFGARPAEKTNVLCKLDRQRDEVDSGDSAYLMGEPNRHVSLTPSYECR